MAARMSRRVNVSQQRSPSPQVSTSTDRSRSQLSPTRLSRIQEKVELQNLNDRLATYIDTVRQLESENNRLNTLIRTTQETTTREVSSVKNVYEKELSDVRKVLDATAKEKAKLQLEVENWRTETEDARIRLSKREKDLATAEKQLKTSEFLNQDLQRRVSQLGAENRKLEVQLRDAVSEINNLLQQVSSLKKSLDDETLTRVDLENRLQSAKEEMSFKESIHQSEITETRHLKETEISEINTKIAENYEQRLADTLKELREQYETQIRMNKDEIESIYETKILNLQKKLDRNSEFSATYRDELRSLKSKVDTLTSNNANLESSNSSLQSKIRDLEKMLVQEREWHNEALQSKNKEIDQLREQIESQLAEYRDLLDIKVALDLEISAYRKLIEGEESRLNMSPVGSRASSPQPFRSTPSRSNKRKRTVLTDTEKSSIGYKVSSRASGEIDISHHDVKGEFIKLHNKGKQEISVAGWQLVQKGSGAEVVYKLPRTAIIKPNSTITVWSSDSGTSHSPPQNYIMKNQSWCAADIIQTVLINNNGDEVAVRESVKMLESSEVQHSEEK